MNKVLNKLWGNIQGLLAIGAFATIISVGIGYAEDIKKNTEHRHLIEYGQLMGWIEKQELECGEDGKNCAEYMNDVMDGWKLRLKELNKKLGYTKE